MSKGDAKHKKEAYFQKLKGYLEEYKAVFIVSCDNVGSNQMHQVRQSLRGEATVLMGKNTMVRRALKVLSDDHPEYEKLIPHVKGNVGFVFTNGDLKDIREKVLANRVAAPAKAGAVAPVDVTIPAGGTGMEPGKTAFFQALGIPTKIAKGTIEITQDVHLIKKDTKVGPSEATLLNMMNISPFTYGLVVAQVYDNGTVFHPTILDVTDEAIVEHLMSGIKTVAAISLATHFPTVAAVPHLLVNTFKNLLAISAVTDYTFKESEKLKEYLADPSKFAAAAAPASSGSAAPAAAAAPPPEEEEEEEEEVFDLFD